ncbi:MAG TPA: glycosyltransferase family 39 protein [Terriglobales bacterium]|nr:glycosyltransferase family 39 protein [Terriglobales bacterium]
MCYKVAVESASPNPRNEKLLVGTLALLALVWRFLYIGHESLWIDEAASVGIVRLPWIDFFKVLWRREGNMTLYYLLLRPWVFFGSSEAWIRAVSAVFSAGTVPFVYLIGRELRDRRTGLIASLLFALSPFAVEYAQEARGYSLACLLVTAGSWFLLRGLKSSDVRAWKWWGVSMVLAVYAHFFAALVLLVHLLYSAKNLPKHRALLGKMALALMPIAAFITLKRLGQLNWVPPLSWSGLTSAFSELAGGADLALVLLPMAALAAIIYWGKQANTLFLWMWLLVPVGLILLGSFAQPMLAPRFLIICLPPFLLLAATALVSLPRSLVLAILAVILFFSVRTQFLNWKTDTKDDWRSATSYVLDNSKPSDGILFHQALGRQAFTYYEGREKANNAPMVITPARGDRMTYRDFEAEMEDRVAAKLEQAPSRLWIVLNRNTPRGTPDEYTRFLLGLVERRYDCRPQEFRGIEVFSCTVK